MPVTSSTSSGRSRPDSVQLPSRRWRMPRAEAVVLVGDVADDLLDDVLERHDAGVAAVLVEHDGHLEAVLAQQREQRVEPQGVGHDDRA